MQARRPSVEVGELLLVKRANGAVWRSAKQVRLWDNYNYAARMASGEEENCRRLGGITGHEGLVCLVGLHLECVGGQFKGRVSRKKVPPPRVRRRVCARYPYCRSTFSYSTTVQPLGG